MSFNAVTRIEGQMAPLPRGNVDTDQIMPKNYLKRVERSGFGAYLFHDWAYDEEGEKIPDFVLNRQEYRDATVLVSGPNFGSGSSREHAPWGIEDWGFRAVVAPSFADIFYNNSVNIGLVPIVVSEEAAATLARIAEDAANTVVIDMALQTVTAGDFTTEFEIDAFAKHRLMNGLDNIGLTLEHGDSIDSFESSRQKFKPSLAN
jgi:3-isopropylmalate/(R)-2-methylmalate dehydratase small subunit